MSSHIKYEELLEIISWGLISKEVKGTQLRGVEIKQKIEGAVYGGVYIGSPGKDIFLMLKYLNKVQMEEVAYKLCEQFPITPPGNHVNVAACIRFIYGQFDKNGILRSNEDFERMKKEKQNWDLSRKFLGLLYKEFEKNNNYYGLSILCEMEGHRLGDESVLNNDKGKLKDMESKYRESVLFAYKCKSYKQMFTPYFWASLYFLKFGDTDNVVKYSKLTVKQAEKYCPDSRGSYIDKVEKCLKNIKKANKKEWKSFCNKYKKIIKNTCVKKAFKRV